MAYVPKELKQTLVSQIKPILKKYGMKATFSVKDYSTFNINVKEGQLFNSLNNKHKSFRHLSYSVEKEFKGSKEFNFLKEIIDTVNQHNHDDSDSQRDYFDTGFYFNINLGKFDKPYTFKP